MKTKSLRTRIVHAIGFEVLAILLVSPLAAWIMGRPLWQMGTVAIVLSLIALLWNISYNTLFDRCWPPQRVARTLRVRVLHALGFEGGFILIALPVTAWILGVSLWQALMLEIAFFLFFLPYTVVYNGLFDLLHARLHRRAQKQHAGLSSRG